MWWNPPRGILSLGDFRHIRFHAVVVFGLGKDHLFKSVYADLDTYFVNKRLLGRY